MGSNDCFGTEGSIPRSWVSDLNLKEEIMTLEYIIGFNINILCHVSINYLWGKKWDADYE